MLTTKINLILYPYTIDFLLVESIENSEKSIITKHLTKLKTGLRSKDLDLTECLGKCIEYNNNNTLIVINKHRLKSLEEFLVTLRHEVHHASANVFSYIEEEIYSLDTETFLYLNDYIMLEILKTIDIKNLYGNN